MAVPESWRFNSEVKWNYEHNENPVTVAMSAENPASSEAVFGYPQARYFYLRPSSPYLRPGQNSGGQIFAVAQPPVQVLASLVQQARAGAAKLHYVGSKDLPELPAALNVPPGGNQRGVGVKITYELGGGMVEEEFYGVFYSIDVPYDGPQGRTWQINWGFTGLHSFRAPLGTLDRRRPIFAAVAKSFRPNPAWQQRLAAINAYLAEQFNRQLQAGYDAIAAAGRLSRQISANNDAMIAAIDRQLQASRTSSAGGSTGRSAVEKFDDYGNYRNSNETSYDPNRTEAGNWQLMKPTR